VANSESERMRLSKLHNVPPDRILISLTELGGILGLTRNPLMDKIREGLPWLEEGSQGRPKKNWAFDSKAVIDWLCDKARQEGHEAAVRKMGGVSPASGAAAGEGGRGGMKDGEDEVDFRTRVAKMHQEEIKAGLAAKGVARTEPVVFVFRAHMADASHTMQSVKGRVMAYLDKVGVPLVESERIVGNVIDDACAKFAKADPFRSPLEVTAEDDEDDAPATVPDEPEPEDLSEPEDEVDVDSDA